MKKIVWLIAAFLVVGVVLFAVNQNREVPEATTATEVVQEPVSKEEIPAESVQPEQDAPAEGDTPTLENTDPVTEEDLQQAWEDLTQQFSEMGELELPEDVF